MKHFLKGAAVLVIIIIVLMVINVICNMNGIDLDSVSTGTVAAVGAMLIYDGLLKREKNKDDSNKRCKVLMFGTIRSTTWQTG